MTEKLANFTVTRSYDEAGRLTGETQALTGGPIPDAAGVNCI